MSNWKTAPATEKAIAFLTLLANERDVPENLAADIAARLDFDGFTGKEASTYIDVLKQRPRKPAPVNPDLPTEPGMYRLTIDGVKTFFKVKWNRPRTNLYALVVVARDGHVDFKYDATAIHALDDGDRMEWHEAHEFGMAFHTCVNCGAALGGETDESDKRAVVAGYGQTCARNNGWPFPKKAEAADVLNGTRTWVDCVESRTS